MPKPYDVPLSHILSQMVMIAISISYIDVYFPVFDLASIARQLSGVTRLRVSFRKQLRYP
ncbi:hypothetical protein BS17DRAFT_785923 [Gyrodon lividus]|nr:hypothetical protein BS17DRAFT_785923 [Gyrodon lividus]